MSLKWFRVPSDIVFGKGSLEYLKKIKAHKAVVVTGGSSMQKYGFLDKVVNYLESSNIEVKKFEGVEPDPSVETVMKGAKFMREFNPDLIVAIGGGSPIDAAKAMWIFYEHPELSFDDIKEPFSIPELREKAKFVAIPSTSGTATEVTSFSVITDYSKKIKYPLADYNLTPDVAIVDTNLVMTMPAKLTAHTGMDALTHAIEAYVATLHTPFTDPLALQAIDIIVKNLKKSYDTCDENAREQMHIAQCLAGMAFSNAFLGITHSIAHKIGASFNIPHGCANAILLPYVIKFNTKECADRYAAIAKHINLEGKTDDELVDALINKINSMNKELNIVSTLKAYGVSEEYFKEHLGYISVNALSDPCTGSNPRKIDEKQMEKLLTCAYYGTEVDF